MEEEIKNKLYLNPIHEINSYRKKLNPIRQKILFSSSNKSNASKSLPDLFKGLNGTVIMQNWNTKKNIPNEIGEYINYPSLIDKKKIFNIKKINMTSIIKKHTNLSLLEKIKQSKFDKTSRIEDKEIKAIKKNNYYKKYTTSDFLKKKLEHKRSNSTFIIERTEEGKSEALIPITDRTQIRSKNKEIRTELGFRTPIIKKKYEPIDFSTFRQYLYLRDNDFLYAKRVGGPVDFALCSYKDINKNFKQNSFKTNMFSKGYINKNCEYLTISKNTILHYQKGIPQIYTISDWTNNYIKYKKLMNISLFKNFKNAKLFELWKRYYRKKQRLYYTEKLRKRTIFVEKNLLNGILEIRKILKEMSLYDLLRLNILTPVFLHKFNQIHSDILFSNNLNIEKFKIRVKKELSTACNKSYIEFKKQKNITLDDPMQNDGNQKSDKNKKTISNISEKERDNEKEKDNKNEKDNNEKNSIKTFLKDAIPYAQDATRKRHFKKLLRYIRLVDFLFNYAKSDLILNSLKNLGKKFERLYEAYTNKWNDIPLLITMVLPLGDKISYNPSIELIKAAIFDNFIQENIYSVINVKNFVDPEEFPQYMICFEEVFDISVDQNGALNTRIKQDREFNKVFNDIKENFEKCHEALDKTAADLSPSLKQYNKFMKINFNKVEAEADHTELINYIQSFKEEGEIVRKLNKKINIGIFEFHLELFLEQIVNVPFQLLKKIYGIIPKILLRKVEELTQEIDMNYNNINIIVNMNDIEAFIKLKKAVDHCNAIKSSVEEKVDEIQELNNIVMNHKEIKLEDFEKRKYEYLINIRTNYERKLDTMIYFIEQNIQQYRGNLMIKIRKYDEMLKKIHHELNEDQVNKYNENTLGPILFLEEKSFRISKAIENKKIFQQQEIDIEMDENIRSNFEHLDLVTYEYDLKMNIWRNLHEYQEYTVKWEKTQIMEIKLNIMEKKLKKWKKECIIAIKDLDDADVAKQFLGKIKIYEKILHILKIIYNDNIQKIDYLKELVRNALNVGSIDFLDASFLLEKLISLNGLFEAIPTLDEINRRANEENKIKDIYKKVLDNFSTHHIPFKVKVDNEKGIAKYIITFEDFDKEYEFIEKNISQLNKELLNPYISVIEREFRILVNNIYKYQYFLETFYDYQLYMLKIDNLIFNSEFSKEFPAEFKKLSNESLTKSLMKTLKDSTLLSKYIEYAHERSINNLKTLINNYEINYKSINQFLLKKRRDFQEYYLLNNEDLISLIESKDSYEIRQKLLLKIFPFIDSIDPGKESDENLKFITKKEKEEIVIKYNKTTRTFRDGIECIEFGLAKKIKDHLKNFKKIFDNSIKPKSNTKPKNLIYDLFIKDTYKEHLYQLIFIFVYHVIFYSLEKTLEKENEAFDKMFDLYHELKDEWEKKFIKILKEEKFEGKTKLLISIIAIVNYFIKTIENLIREDVTKISDYTFNKVLQIKIENDNVNIKLFNYNFEYGNEYVGLNYDFFILPQTEKTFLSIINSLYYHKSFILYNNQSFFKKEIFYVTSNILGRNISYFTSNQNLSLPGLDNIIYGNMRNGQIVCFEHIELINLNILKILIERINEIFRLIHSKLEEGYFNDRNGEKYSINNKKFNLFLTYNIDSFHIKNKNYFLPLCIKNNFRVIGINYIDFDTYIKLIFNSYSINRANEITSKIKFIINGLIYKGNLLNKKNLKEVIFPYLFDKLKNELIIKRNEINKRSVNNIVKKCLLDIITPFIKGDSSYKEDIETLINIILFDYEECERINNIQKKKKMMEENKKVIIEEKKLTVEDNIFINSFKKFNFDKGNYIEKIQNLYYSLKNNNSFILLGPTLTGKSNSLVILKDISIKLNKINNDLYPVISYIKIYPNFKQNEDIFITNHIKTAYQNNNIYFKNMINFLDEGGNLLDELHGHYKKIFYIKDIKDDEEKEKEKKVNSRESLKDDNLNENNWNEEYKKNLRPIKNECKLIIFDGSISYEWCRYLTNYVNENNNFSFHDGDYINLSRKKILFETTSLSKASPSFITKQNIISFDYNSFDWLNICYSYIDSNYKTTKNEELKNYIKGLFENYLPGIIDFIEVNKLKNIAFCINNNFLVKNLINIFDTFLPEFDFTDIKIGRRNDDYIPRIEIVKNQTLSIFIFCSAWIMNLLTNFLIRNKIEKVVGDIFKANDLKGPIFDYYLDENNSLCLWSQLLKQPKYNPPTYKKNTIYYYDHNFIFTIENFPYFYILNQLILSNTPLFVFGKHCTGVSFLINKCLSELENNKKAIKSINIKVTYGISTNYIENKINKNMDLILKRVLGDKYLRQTVVYIDDVNLCEKNNNFNEYVRYLLNEKLTYDNKYNQIKYYKDFNIINSGNYYNNLLKNNHCINDCCYDDDNEKIDFVRYINQFSLITLNLSQSNYINLYKPTLEFHFRNYIPNISNIISNQYLSVLFKINELLNNEINNTYYNIHYYINIRDITKVVQKFNKFIFRGSNEYTEYLKKIFLYEIYCVYSDKFNLDSDIELFKNILVKAYNSSFKQDKIDIDIFNNIDKDNSFIFCRNFLDVYNENTENKYIPPKEMEYVFVEEKKDLKNYIIDKMKSYYSDFYSNGGIKGTEDIFYIIHDYNDYMINTIIRMVRLLDNEYPNIILIGKNYSGKEIMMKIALYIMRYNYIDINMHKLLSKNKEIFEEETIIRTLAEVVFNNKKIFLLFQHEVFNNLNEQKQIYIFELISSLIEPDIAFEKYRVFMDIKSDKNNYYNKDENLSINEIKLRIKNNLQVIVSVDHYNYVYKSLFINYPNIVKKSNTLFVHSYNNNSLKNISNIIFGKCQCSGEILNNNNNILIDIHNFAKMIYEEFSKKINIDIPINQRNYLSMCEFFSKNYKRYKDILNKKRENYEKIFNTIEKVGNVIKEKEQLIEDLNPNKEKNEKLIEDSRKQITNKNAEKNRVKGKRSEEDKKIKESEKQKELKKNQFEELFRPIKESIRKIGGSISRFTDKDIVDCKNTWENFQFGKFLLQKVFIFLGDGNGDDYDYIKKNLSAKQLKRFVNVDFTQNRPEYHMFVNDVLENPDFDTFDRYNKNYRLAGLICDYATNVNKYFKLYEDNIELRNEIYLLEKKIEESKILINNYIEEFKKIDKEIDEIQRKIENYELNKNNVSVQIDKYNGLINAYNIFIKLTKDKENIWLAKKQKIENILKYFDYYMIYISAYINYAPILNCHSRLKFKNFLVNIMNESIENFTNKTETSKSVNNTERDNKMTEELPIPHINFVDLMFNFLDITGVDKELYTSSSIYKNFLRENFIIMHISKNKTPFIIDYTQYGKQIITEYLEFERMQSIQTVTFNNNSNEQSNEFRDKLNNSIRNGIKLFVEGINDINKIYYLFYNYINHRFGGDKYKRTVIIDDHKYSLHDNFKLYIFKNVAGKEYIKMDNNIWFNMLIINFNISKEDIKEKIFLDISKNRNELAYNGLKKIRNEKIKESLRKLETEKKMINSILQLDTSGNIDRLTNTETLNEKYTTECQMHSIIQSSIESLEYRYKKQRLGLNVNYDKLCNDASHLFKWIMRFNLLEISYLIKPSILMKYLNDFIEEKIIIKKQIFPEEDKEYNKLKEIINDEEKEAIIDNEEGVENEDNPENDESNESKKEEENDDEEKKEEEKEEPINKVKDEEFIYEKNEDVKALIIFIYNKIKSIYIRKDLQDSLLLLFSFLCANLQRKIPIPFKQSFLNYYLWSSNFDIMIDLEEIKKSPINNINNQQWTIINKINLSCSEIFEDLINNIQKEKEKWNNYLNDNLTQSNINNNYYLNSLILPDKNLDACIDPLIKFIFFSIVKPHKKEFITKIFLENTIYNVNPIDIRKKITATATVNNNNDINNESENENDNNFKNKISKTMEDLINNLKSEKILENIEDYDLTKAFKNFNLKEDHALILFAPQNNINLYDNILYNHCYLKMFNNSNMDKNQQAGLNNSISNGQNSNEHINIKSNKVNEENTKENNIINNKNEDGVQQAQGMQILNEVKYKEIILENNDLSQQDFDFIKNNIKIGAIIIIKNAQSLGNQFTDLLSDINNIKPEDISPAFKLILICNNNQIINNKKIYDECLIINDNLLYDEEYINQNKDISIKNRILNITYKIPLEIYTLLLNNANLYMRLFLRKIIFHYILIFGCFQSMDFKNPFYFSNKDFYCLCKFIINFIESELPTEEKYNDFMNVENINGYNYVSFINILNNIFILSRQIEHNDEYKINKLINEVFNQKYFMIPDYYINIYNIQINTTDYPVTSELLFDDIYNSFNNIFSQEYDNLLIDLSKREINERQLKYGNDVYENIINIIDKKDINNKVSNNKMIKFDLKKIYEYLIKMEESIPIEIPYIIQDNLIELENTETINQSLFKKNKFGIYFNCLDESLYYEIKLLNDKINEVHKEITNIINMIKGKTNYNNEYYKIIKYLNDDKIPPLLNIYNNINYLNIPHNINFYLKIIENRINIYKTWLRDGQLECYHLPVFTNIELFFHCLKMNFSKKYYGENDYSKVTPNMIVLRFIPTRYKTFSELSAKENELEYYKDLYKNEIIWADGLVLNNACLSKNNKDIFYNNANKDIKNKMNIVGITYTIEKYEDSNGDCESNSGEDNDNENEEESESQMNKNEEDLKDSKNKNIIDEEDKDKNNEKNYEENKVRVYIYGNRDPCVFNKYYIQESIGYIDFGIDDNYKQNFIYEHDIKITIEDLEELKENIYNGKQNKSREKEEKKE